MIFPELQGYAGDEKGVRGIPTCHPGSPERAAARIKGQD
jgi:hypothetical protein